MALSYQFRPLEAWPGEKTKTPRKSRFDSSFSATLGLLEDELRHLKARNVVVEANVSATDVRLDGMLRANARPRSPGIVLAFDSAHGPLRYPCDRFDDWRDNLRAIALSLQALRAVDRYGVTRRAEQYRGWAKLPAPESVGSADCPPFASADEAAAWLQAETDVVIRDAASFRRACRRAAMLLHPDRDGGSTAAFQRFRQAATLLEPRFGREGES